MEIISLQHHCLFFRFNGKKYLLGLTSSLADDSASARIRPDYVIFPSFPYQASQALLLWHLPALLGVGCQNLLVGDTSVRKRIQLLLSNLPQLTSILFKWELFKQHDLSEDNLMRIFEQHSNKSISKPIRTQPFGLAFNDASDRLNIIVPITGSSLLLLHRGQILLVDPSERIQGTLEYLGLPVSAVVAVILTRPDSLNLFQLLSQHQRTTIITTEHIYGEVRKQLKACFLWDDVMIRKQLRGAVMTQQNKTYRFGQIQFSYSQDQLQAIEWLDLVFGMKRMRIRPQQLTQFPAELIQTKDLELLVINKMVDPLKKDLETAPVAYRKKVLFNRATRKYGNKYFRTLADTSEFISIQAHPYAKLPSPELTPPNLSFLYRHRDANYRLQYCQLNKGQRLNAAERVVHVREGYARNQKGELFSAPSIISGCREVAAQGNALLMYQPLRHARFFQGAQQLSTISLLAGEDLLKKVKENSFIRALSRHKNEGFMLRQLQEQQAQTGSQWQVLNKICQLRTFEAGLQVGNPLSLFFVVKGGLKFKGEEAVAGKSMGIGSIRRFYSSAYEESSEIEAVKDCWAIEIGLKELHNRFFSQFPTRMYELFTKPSIFE